MGFPLTFAIQGRAKNDVKHFFVGACVRVLVCVCMHVCMCVCVCVYVHVTCGTLEVRG